MKRRMEVAVQKDPAGLRITVTGDVDMDSSPRLLEAIRAGLKEARSLQLELKEVGYMDSSGIAVLVQGVKLSRREKARYAILDPSPQVMAVIQLSQLADFFAIERSGGTG